MKTREEILREFLDVFDGEEISQYSIMSPQARKNIFESRELNEKQKKKISTT